MMTGFWRQWLTLWCWAVGLLGLALAGAGFAATDAPALLAMRLFYSGEAFALSEPLRFAIGLMGILTLSLAMLVAAGLRGADLLGERAQPVWAALTRAILVWYVIDSAISCANGFVLNAVSNTGITLLFLLPVIRSGVLRRG